VKIFDRVLQYVRAHGVLYTGVRVWQRLFARGSKRYARWFAAHQPDEAALAEQRARRFDKPLKFSIIVPVYNTKPEFLRELADSFLAQTYADWEACLLDGQSTSPETISELERLKALDERFRVQRADENLGISGNSNLAVAMATGDYLAFCDHDDLYTPDALYRFRCAIDETGAEFLYSDEDKLLNGHLYEPHLKPDYSPDFLRSANYICHLMVYSRDLMARLGGLDPRFDGSQDYDVILRATEEARGVCHVPHVLYHWRMFSKSASHTNHQRCVDAACAAMREHLARCGEEALVESGTPWLRLRYVLKDEPLVSLILWGGTDEKKIRTLLAKTAYRPVEVLVCGKQTGKAMPEDVRVRCVDASGTLFAQLNAAAREAEGEVLCFLHANLLPVNDDWLTELTSHAQRAGVGAVTTVITDRLGRIAHAGYAVAGELPRVHQEGRMFNAPGYMFYERAVRNVAAVSCVCMALRREHFLRTGGFDEGYEASFADADLCLRLHDESLRHVYTPHARLKGGRRWAPTPADIARWQQTWPGLTDPYYNPQFRHENAKYTLK